MCTRCKKVKAIEGKSICPKCSEYFAKRRKNLIDSGICPICGKNPIYLNEKACYECNEHILKLNRRSRKNNRIEYRKCNNERIKRLIIERREKGLCTRCGRRKATVGFSTCSMCRCKLTEYGRVYRQERSANERKDILFDRRAD